MGICFAVPLRLHWELDAFIDLHICGSSPPRVELCPLRTWRSSWMVLLQSKCEGLTICILSNDHFGYIWASFQKYKQKVDIKSWVPWVLVTSFALLGPYVGWIWKPVWRVINFGDFHIFSCFWVDVLGTQTKRRRQLREFSKHWQWTTFGIYIKGGIHDFFVALPCILFLVYLMLYISYIIYRLWLAFRNPKVF